MNQAPGSYGHWRAVEESERDDDADWAFRTVFQTAMPDQPVSPEFTTRTMTAVVAAAADARRARRVRAGMLTGTVAASTAAVYFGAGLAISLASAAFVGLLNVLM